MSNEGTTQTGGRRAQIIGFSPRIDIASERREDYDRDDDRVLYRLFRRPLQYDRRRHRLASLGRSSYAISIALRQQADQIAVRRARFRRLLFERRKARMALVSDREDRIAERAFGRAERANARRFRRIAANEALVTKWPDELRGFVFGRIAAARKTREQFSSTIDKLHVQHFPPGRSTTD